MRSHAVLKLFLEHCARGGATAGPVPRPSHDGGSAAPGLRRGQLGQPGPVLLAGVVRFTGAGHGQAPGAKLIGHIEMV